MEREGHRLTLLPAVNDDRTPASDTGSEHAHWLGCSWETDLRHTIEALQGRAPAWLVVDHYALDERWELGIRARCGKLLVVDDLANRPHSADVLVDQTPGRHPADYGDVLAPGTRCLLGPRHALLRSEFRDARSRGLARRPSDGVQNVLVSMGGVDRLNATGRVLHALSRSGLPIDCSVTVVLGPDAPWLGEVQALAHEVPLTCRVLVDVPDMADLAVRSDIAIGAAGVAALERCCVGLPSVLVLVAENQRRGALGLQAAGAAEFLGSVEEIDAKLAPAVEAFFARPRRMAVARAAAALVDGEGVDRVVAALEAAQ